MHSLRLLLAMTVAVPALAASTPYSVAVLVHEEDAAALTESLRAEIASPTPLIRATAARVVMVRGLTELLPLLRETVKTEEDGTAAREQIRALAMLGDTDDLAAATAAAKRWPAGMDDALALAVARRGGPAAFDAYLSTLRSTRMNNDAEFFRTALWARAAFVPAAASRLLGSGDESGWRGLLGALQDSNMAMHPPVMAASLDAASEDMRSASVWHLIRAHAADPATIPEVIRPKLAEPRTEVSSNREDFGRELLRRMTGGERKDDPRWLQFLASEEADRLLAGQTATVQYLTDREYTVRWERCEAQTRECELPKKRTGQRTIPSTDVPPPAFNLPSVLPAGLGDAIISGAGCRDPWVGVALVTVDSAGRVRELDLRNVHTARPWCRRAVETLMRVSLATNTSMRSAFTGEVVLVRSPKTTACLDEDPPDAAPTSTFHAGGNVQPPEVTKRVEPVFPDNVRSNMGGNSHVLVVVESVISKTGCVRSLRLVRQSPFPELNGAALMALSQWKFNPGSLDGKPVDVIFNLTINFRVN